MEIIRLPIDDLTPDPNNAKEHPEWQIEQIKESIETFGNLDPIGIWGDDNLIVEGHGRYTALQELGFTEVECIRLDWLTEEERQAYALVHNKTTMSSGFDNEILKMTLSEIKGIDMNLFGFDMDAMQGIEPIDADEDGFDEENAKENLHGVKQGDIWELGDHRLMCGSSTDAEDINKLVAGETMDLCVTDPPYNVNYEGTAGKIQNDNMDDMSFHNFLLDFYTQMLRVLKPGGAFYIFHADSEGLNFRSSLKEAGAVVRECLIWVKNSLVLGRQDYQWKHEPCLYGWKEGAGHYFTPSRSETTVIEDEKPDFNKMKKEEMKAILEQIFTEDKPTTVIYENKPTANDLHPTMKPIKLIARLIRNSSQKGDKVFDGFGGSGSTLMACEQLGRKCYTIELDPHYADVILQRWEKFTGKTARKIN